MQDYDTIITNDPKFFGERLAVKLAFEQSLEGFFDDSFGSVHELGYYCRVTLPDGSIVYFCEDEQGFVREVTIADFEAALEAYALLENPE